MSIPHKYPVSVIHNYLTWLNLTENWIYTQVRNLPEEIRACVVCKIRKNHDLFGVPFIYCYSDLPVHKRLMVLLNGIQDLRVFFRRHSSMLNWAAKETNASIVHSHFGYIGCGYARAIKSMGLKHIVTFYGVDISMLPQQNPIWIKRYQKMFTLTDLILCEGPHMAQCVVSMGCPADKVKVHHLGICVDDITYRPRQWTQGQVLKVLIAASFREKKGIPYALEALGQFQQEQDLHVTIIGDAGRYPETQIQKKKILSIIGKYRLQNKVTLMGYQPHAEMLAQAYKHHIFMSPSITASNGDTEGGAPVGLIEMAATGMPVVSSRHCDIPEVIRHRTGGLLAEEKDVEGLKNHLRWLTANPDRWKTMTTLTRQHIEKEYDARQQGVRLAAFYQVLLR